MALPDGLDVWLWQNGFYSELGVCRAKVEVLRGGAGGSPPSRISDQGVIFLKIGGFPRGFLHCNAELGLENMK